MNDKTRRNLESGQSCRQWTVDNVALIPGASMFETKCNDFVALVDKLEDLAGDVESAMSEGVSATDVKGSEREDLTDIMVKVRDAARSADQDNPGTRDRYRFSRNMSDQEFLARGRAFAAGGADDQTLLESYGAPDKWPAAVTTACDEYETSFGQQDSAQGTRVAKNALVNLTITEMNRLKATVGHMVPNFAASDPGAIAAWHSAAHVEAPPKKKPPTP